MRTFHFVLLAVVLGGLVVGAVGCRDSGRRDVDQAEDGALRLGSVEAVDSLSREVAPKDRPLVIEGFQGSIDLTGTEGGTAELRFVRRARGEDAEAAREVLQNVTVTESGTAQTYTFTLASESEAYAAVDVTGTVPSMTELQVNRTSGSLILEGLEGDLAIQQDYGSVQIRDAASSVDVEIQNGDVDAHFRTIPSDATIQLRTSNGNVTIHLPVSASLRLDAETSAGVIRTRDAELTDQEYFPREGGGRYTARMGQGDASVRLRTENGSIVIQGVDTTASAPRSIVAPTVPPSDTTVGPPPTDESDEAPFNWSESDTGRVSPDTTE